MGSKSSLKTKSTIRVYIACSAERIEALKHNMESMAKQKLARRRRKRSLLLPIIVKSNGKVVDTSVIADLLVS